MLLAKLFLSFPSGFIDQLPASQSTTDADGVSPSLAGNGSANALRETQGGHDTGYGDVYKMYMGDGSTADGWPSMDKWMDFASMWQANEATVNASCALDGAKNGIVNDSPSEVDDILDSISTASQNANVDKRLILAVMMQESRGCVRISTTWSPAAGIRNPGLMQTHNGTGTCNDEGIVQTPCPASEIQRMIDDGVTGTSSGNGLKQCLTLAGGSDAQSYYRAARIYNAGRVDASGKLEQGSCTLCYASDIANRLTGWVSAPSTCTLDGEKQGGQET